MAVEKNVTARSVSDLRDLGQTIHSRLAAEGMAVMVISSYLPEVLSLSDRILVAQRGRIVAEFDAADATEDKIMYAAIHC